MSTQRMAFSSSGNWLASAHFDNSICVWNMKTFSKVKALSGHQKAVINLLWTDDEKRLLTFDQSSLLKIWDQKSGF